MCAVVNGNIVEWKLRFKTTHELLNFSMCTNIPGCDSKIFECREDDSDEAINKLVKCFLN